MHRTVQNYLRTRDPDGVASTKPLGAIGRLPASEVATATSRLTSGGDRQLSVRTGAGFCCICAAIDVPMRSGMPIPVGECRSMDMK